MIDARTRDQLLEIVGRASRSLLQFVGEAFPWTTAEKSQAVDRLQRLVAEEAQATNALARFLQRQHVVVPTLPPYPMAFTSLPFVSLDYLLPHLIAYQRKAVADLERDVRELGDADARAAVQTVLELKRRHLKQLEELAGAASAATVTS